jgi:carbamoyltransferase
MNIIGISAYYHDAAACLVQDGRIVAAAQEERFTRKKHDASFPVNAIRYCLAEAGLKSGDMLDAVAFYEKPVLKFSRILETYLSTAPKGLESFVMAIPLWMRKKLWIPLEIEKQFDQLGIKIKEDIYFPEHHESHAASAFFPSPFPEAAILTLDGAGEWATSTLGVGRGNRIQILKEMRFPHSLGLLYSAFTYFTGFRVNSGEYKLMGLAPYGKPIYKQRILDHLIDLKEDGSFRLNMDYFGYLDGLKMTSKRFEDLFDGPPRQPESVISPREMNLARSIQEVTEEIVLKIAAHARNITGCEYACMAGGVALNCVANGRLLRQGLFKDIWIQPAAGDAGGALGAALSVWHTCKNQPRRADGQHDQMQGACLGPQFDDDQIGEFLTHHRYPSHILTGAAERSRRIAELIAQGKVVGCVQGRMEFGPRALGNRSILGDARSPTMQSVMNLKIKYRESFRPFAPACLEECAGSFFELDRPSPYMQYVAPIHAQHRHPEIAQTGTDLGERIHQIRSDIPAVTHVDGSARVQTVNAETNPLFYGIIKAFEELTGVGLLINTSFNVRGEPIVCTPEDAYRCFMRTEMDGLVLGSHILYKGEQPAWRDQ